MEQLMEYFDSDAKIITRRQAWQVRNDWRQTFSASVKESTNRWVINDEDWHTFSFGYYPFLKNEAAAAKIVEQTGVSGELFSSNPNYEYYGLEISNITGGKLLELVDFLANHTSYYDLYFLDLDRTWTAVFTHEPEFGLIFAERN